jgi:hypothetical protein
VLGSVLFVIQDHPTTILAHPETPALHLDHTKPKEAITNSCECFAVLHNIARSTFPNDLEKALNREVGSHSSEHPRGPYARFGPDSPRGQFFWIAGSQVALFYEVISFPALSVRSSQACNTGLPRSACSVVQAMLGSHTQREQAIAH